MKQSNIIKKSVGNEKKIDTYKQFSQLCEFFKNTGIKKYNNNECIRKTVGKTR